MSHPRIAIVGPFTPYRGGIASHTTRLREAMQQIGCETHSEAFRNPFPKWLYPGTHQGDLKQHKDCLPDVNYDLSYAWPGAWPRMTRRIVAFRPDAVVIPWWTFFFAPHVRQLSTRLHKHGIPTVFLCHNLFDHEGARWKQWISRKALSTATAFVFHSPEEARIAKSLYPETPSLVSPHPIYDHFPLSGHRTAPGERLELLFFGLVRPYKGLEDLIEAIELIGDRSIRLTVAGEWWAHQDSLKERCRNLEAEGRVRLIDRYLSDAEAAAAFQDCDAVILPYRRATNSGVLAHALQARKPVIVTKTGALPEMVTDGNSGLVVPPQSPRSLQDAIHQLGEMIEAGHDFQPAIERQCAELGWDVFAKRLVTFLDGLIEG